MAYYPLTNPLPVVDTPTTDTGPTTSIAKTTALAASLVVKASAGNLYGFSGYRSTSSTVYYIQVHNATSLPANGSVPIISFPLAAAIAPFSFNVGNWPINFSTGIVIAASTTGPTLTVAGALFWFVAQYE